MIEKKLGLFHYQVTEEYDTPSSFWVISGKRNFQHFLSNIGLHPKVPFCCSKELEGWIKRGSMESEAPDTS